MEDEIGANFASKLSPLPASFCRPLAPCCPALKADLHLHSRFSDRSPEWLFRQAGLAASYSQPADLYDALRARGMDFVTFTDDNTIDGCLAIADRPGVFLSEQITALFPEDRVPVHVLVWDITEAQ